MPGLRVCRHFFDDEGIDATDRRSCSSDLNPEVRFVYCTAGAHGCPDPGLGGADHLPSGECTDGCGSTFGHVVLLEDGFGQL